jgi:hypothetical protein
VKESWRWHALVILAASATAVISARPYPGGWNDCSRLATVECLVDHATWAIDESSFDTQDRLWIGGRFYSDKSPVPAVFMAGEYACLQRVTGLTARNSPDEFCRWMTILSSGLAYIAAAWCIFRLGVPLGLALKWRLFLTASFALATIAPVYAQQVNNHVLLLAVAAEITVELAWLTAGHTGAWRVAAIGALAGLGYTIDLGVGPVLLLATACLVVFRCRRRPAIVVLAGCAALPWLLLHHTLNYSIGGTIGPANAVAAYLQWPGSPFTPQSITGGWNHPSLTRFALYSLDMLVGKRGFLGHDLPLYLVVVTIPIINRLARRERPELLHALGWSLGAWLLYAATSTNSSGVCCSIRWLVPLLAPGYFALAVLMRDRPDLRPDFLLLSGWGVVYSGFAMAGGPWHEIGASTNWVLLAGAGASWLAVRRFIASRHEISAPRIQSRAA